MNEPITDLGAAPTTPKEQEEAQASRSAKQIAGTAKETMAAMKESTRQAAARVKEMGADAAREMKDESRNFAELRKQELGQRIKGGGEAIRRAAEKLREADDPNLANYAEIVAKRLEGMGEYVRSTDLGSIRHDLENAARRRPELVFGGMFIAGLAISRFLKASAHDEPENHVADTSDDEAYETADESMWESVPTGTPLATQPEALTGSAECCDEEVK